MTNKTESNCIEIVFMNLEENKSARIYPREKRFSQSYCFLAFLLILNSK